MAEEERTGENTEEITGADESYNSADPKQVKRRRVAARKAAKDDTAVMKAILDSALGRGWIWRFLEQCHIFETSFSTDALTTAFREGERNQGLRVLSEVLRADPAAYLAMTKENTKEISNG